MSTHTRVGEQVDAELAVEWLAPGSYFRSAALHMLEVAHLLAGNVGSLDATAAQLKERSDGEDPDAIRFRMRLAASLTPAELRILPLLATHLSFREIGARLYISRNTVKTEAISAYRKLGASSRSEAVEHAVELGLIAETAATGACDLGRRPEVTPEQLSQLALVVVAIVDGGLARASQVPPMSAVRDESTWLRDARTRNIRTGSHRPMLAAARVAGAHSRRS
jgi:DNA-binding CsgD family transcriptional regulator